MNEHFKTERNDRSFHVCDTRQMIVYRIYHSNFLHNGFDSKCNFCDTFGKTIEHRGLGCLVSMPNESKRSIDNGRPAFTTGNK